MATTPTTVPPPVNGSGPSGHDDGGCENCERLRGERDLARFGVVLMTVVMGAFVLVIAALALA